MNKEELLDLIEKCKKGDKSSFKYIMLEYADYVFALAFRILCNEDEAKDVVQETFIRLWKNLEKYNPEIKITTWIYKIATNLCLDRIKSSERKHLIYNIEHKEIVDCYTNENFSEQPDNQKIAEIIDKLANQLGPKQKIVFVLKDIEGLENDEIEQITGMDKGQIKSNLYCARQQIKNSLIQSGYEMR
jgi:RNA polymerase sigma-70 factor, ECF subfamily